jgi:hypothetical protein
MIGARMRHGSAWSDARILNISSRGLLIHAPKAPQRGSYIEVCRGQLRIVARVIWTEDERFGVQTQDRLPVDSISMGIEPPAAAAAERATERRAGPRQPTPAERHERSRQRSRLFEFVCVAACGFGAAWVAFESIERTLSRPLSMVSARLAGNPDGVSQ